MKSVNATKSIDASVENFTGQVVEKLCQVNENSDRNIEGKSNDCSTSVDVLSP